MAVPVSSEAEISSDIPPRHRSFLYLYLAGPEGLRGIGGRCWKAVGGQGNLKNCSRYASRLLNRPEIQAEIERFVVQLQIRAESVIAETHNVALADPLAYYDPEGGGFLPLDRMDPRARRAIKQLQVREDGSIEKIVLHNKVEALRLEATILGLTKKGFKQRGTIPLEIVQEIEDAANELDEDEEEGEE